MVKWIKSYGQIRQMGYSIVILLRRSLELKDGYLKSGYWSGFQVTFPDMLYQLIEYLRSNCYKERLAKWGFNGDLLCQFCKSRNESKEHHFLLPFPRRIFQPFLEGTCMTKGWDAGKLKFSKLQISFVEIKRREYEIDVESVNEMRAEHEDYIVQPDSLCPRRKPLAAKSVLLTIKHCMLQRALVEYI